MNDEAIVKIVTKTVRSTMATLRWEDDRKTAYGVLLMISLRLLRLTEGDEFVKDWLHGALASLDTPLPDVRSSHTK